MAFLVKVFAIKIYCLIDFDWFFKFFRIYIDSFILCHLFILLSTIILLLITNLYDFYR